MPLSRDVLKKAVLIPQATDEDAQIISRSAHLCTVTQSGHPPLRPYHPFRYDAFGGSNGFRKYASSMVAVGETQLQCYESGTGDPVLMVSGWPQGREQIILEWIFRHRVASSKAL